MRQGTAADLPRFYELYLETSERDHFVPRPRRLHRAPVGAPGPVRHGRAPAGGGGGRGRRRRLLPMSLGRRAWYLYGASSERGQGAHAAYLIQWEAMRWARDAGLRRLRHVGGPQRPLGQGRPPGRGVLLQARASGGATCAGWGPTTPSWCPRSTACGTRPGPASWRPGGASPGGAADGADAAAPLLTGGRGLLPSLSGPATRWPPDQSSFRYGSLLARWVLFPPARRRPADHHRPLRSSPRLPPAVGRRGDRQPAPAPAESGPRPGRTASSTGRASTRSRASPSPGSPPSSRERRRPTPPAGGPTGATSSTPIVLDGVTVCHLGRLDQLPASGQLQEMGSPDVILLALGEGAGMAVAPGAAAGQPAGGPPARPGARRAPAGEAAGGALLPRAGGRPAER